MTVNFVSSRPVFRGDNINTASKECSTKNIISEQKPDVFRAVDEQPEQKKSALKSTKEKFINIRKTFINMGQMVYGTVKGALFGSIAGGTVLAVDAVRNISKKSAVTKEILNGIKNKESIEALQKVANKMPKRFSVAGVAIAGIAAAGVIAYNLVQAKLNANEAGAKLDHRWNTGHNE